MIGFFVPEPAGDERYAILRTNPAPIVAAARDFVQTMWEQCGGFLDPDLNERASRAFIPAFWELYVAFALHSNKVPLAPRRERSPARSGPDILTRSPRAIRHRFLQRFGKPT